MHFGGLTNRKLNQGCVEFGCCGIYVYSLQALPCRSALLLAPWCRNVFQELFHPWCQLTKHGVMKVQDQKTHCDVNISYSGQLQKQAGSGEVKSQFDIFSIIRYVKFQMQDSILIDTQSKQKFSPIKDILNSAYIIINAPHHFSFFLWDTENRIIQNSCVCSYVHCASVFCM